MLVHISINLGEGNTVRVQIGDTKLDAIATDGSFAVKPGQTLAPGSSGWINAQGKQTRWMELFLRSGSAWESFARPSVGTYINIL
ncbi:MAG: hypothetical protein PUP93_05125 [Rhizonema sp. NSF051]|nr:hypothetical protein [Rhizonema sp. NSF051]